MSALTVSRTPFFRKREGTKETEQRPILCTWLAVTEASLGHGLQGRPPGQGCWWRKVAFFS